MPALPFISALRQTDKTCVNRIIKEVNFFPLPDLNNIYAG
jgi:hypothetical protein